MQDRNSYSKTDPDATFFRMKEDHFNNSQLKPAYNIQVGTENQYITFYSIHQEAADTSTVKEHLCRHEEILGCLPEEIIADSGYGSLENYTLLAEKGIKAYVKYNWFHKEQTRKFKEEWWRSDNFPYNHENDTYTCPAGKPMKYEETKERTTSTGFIYQVRIYKATGCRNCPLRAKCHKSRYNRRIEINNKLQFFKERAQALLNSEEGKKRRSRRPVEVEAAFGQIKQNMKFRRFNLRGKNKIAVELGLLSIAFNLKKLAKALFLSKFTSYIIIYLRLYKIILIKAAIERNFNKIPFIKINLIYFCYFLMAQPQLQ